MKRQSAFTLVEVLYVIILMPFFMLIAGQVFYGICRTVHSAQQVFWAQATFDAASNALWRDVASATQITLSNPGDVTITQANGNKINWKVERADLLRQGSDRRQFKFSENMRFEITVEDNQAVIRMISRHGVEDELKFTSIAAGRRQS